MNKEWHDQCGGRLRVFTKPGIEIFSADTEKGAEPFSFWDKNGYDIDPLYGRLVIFRSGIVEHAVMPCFRQERMALTYWSHGSGPV